MLPFRNAGFILNRVRCNGTIRIIKKELYYLLFIGFCFFECFSNKILTNIANQGSISKL